MRVHYSNQKKGKIVYSGTEDVLGNGIIRIDFYIYDTKKSVKEDFMKLIDKIFENNEK